MKRLMLKNLDKDEFKEYYSSHSYEETAEYFGLCITSIFNMAAKLKLSNKGHIRKIKNSEEFKEYYSTHSVDETAEYFGVSGSSVDKWARKLCIPRKNLRYKDFPDIELTQMQKDIIFGSLLGDGSLTKMERKSNFSSFRETHSMHQRDYLYWKYELLKPFSVDFKENVKNNKKYLACKMRTMFHPIFTKMEREWYLRDSCGNYILKNNLRVKVVPKSIKLNPLTVAVWYFDDGWRPQIDNQIYISTQGFSANDCDYLVAELKNIGIEFCYVRKGNEIAVSSKSNLDFLNMVEEYLPAECLQYKISREGRSKLG